MKLFKQLTLIALVLALLTGCGAQPATPEEEQAIQNVIMTYDKAYFSWDMETARACVTDDYNGWEDPEATMRGAADIYVTSGDIVPADVEKYLEIERKYYQIGSEQMQYRNWEITVSGDTATALVTYGYPNVDGNMSYEILISKEYRDGLFQQVCGMDELTAKASLSAEEFSGVYLQVMDLDYQKRSENVSYIENVTELRLRKVDGKWLISELVLPEA